MRFPRLSVLPDPRPSRAAQHHRNVRKEMERENPGFDWTTLVVLGLTAVASAINVEKEVEKREARHLEEKGQERERPRRRERNRHGHTGHGSSRQSRSLGRQATESSVSPSSIYGDHSYHSDADDGYHARGRRRSHRDRRADHHRSSSTDSDDDDDWYDGGRSRRSGYDSDRYGRSYRSSYDDYDAARTSRHHGPRRYR